MVQIRLLLVEDSESDAALLLRSLSRQGLDCECLRVQSLAALEAALGQGGWDVVVSDYNLPSFDGMLALQVVRAQDLDLPFLLVSGKVGEEMAVMAMRSGASDFLTKDHLDRLGPVIERELREAENRRGQRRYEAERRTLQRAIGQAPDSILITDREGIIVYVNPALEAISGYGAAELIGQKPSLLKSDRHDLRYYECLWETILRGEVWRGAIVNKRKDGSLWNADSAISPVWDGEGRLVNFVCTARDTTHEHLLQDQLEHSQRLGSLGLLTAGIAHDFNNLLMPILGCAELAQARPGLDAALQKDLAIIRAAAQRAAALVRQILSFSRSQGKELQPVELHSVVAESMKLLRAALPTTIRFQLDLSEGSGFVLGDPTQLHQILLNLCTNAAHAMRGRVGTLTVSLRSALLEETLCAMEARIPAGTYLCLTVADEGRGMTPETLSQIFLPFFTNKPSGEGTGLGLSILHGIVRDMGGGVQVESQPDAGTTFRVYFPVHARGLPAVHPSEEPLPRGHGSLLVVDDETEILTVLEEGLTRAGFQVATHADPRQALEAFRSRPAAFDLVLTDFTMPGMDGLQFAAEIRGLSPTMPILLMTGDNSFLETEPYREVGFGGVLRKPCGLHEVVKAVQHGLGRRT